MDVTKHEQVADLDALEGEDWHARPPNMPTARRHTEQFLAMKAVEPHLAADTIARQSATLICATRYDRLWPGAAGSRRLGLIPCSSERPEADMPMVTRRWMTSVLRCVRRGAPRLPSEAIPHSLTTDFGKCAAHGQIGDL